MKKGIYCSEVSNVKRFTQGVKTLDNRGAEEASWLLLEGDSGLGKTTMLQWYAVQQDAALVRAKPHWTIASMLKEICVALDIEPAHTKDLRFNQIVNNCVLRNPILIVDEIDTVVRHIDLLETLRSITDITGITLIVAGMKGIRQKIKAHKQVYNRIADVVEFTPATVVDVRAICTALSDFDIADDLVDRIYRETGGINREILNSIARIELAMGRNKDATATAAMVSSIQLTNDGRAHGTAKTRAA